MVEYVAVMIKNSFMDLGPFLTQLQGFYRDLGFHLSQQEALMVSIAGIGLVLAVLIWMVSIFFYGILT